MVGLSSVVFGAEEESEKKSKFFLYKLDYDDRIYSRSKKSEIGQEIRLRGKLRYQFSEDTSFTLGAKIFPEEGSVDDKTSKIELEGKHAIGNATFRADFDLYTNDKSSSSAGTTFGFDQDSENTYVSYKLDTGLYATLYPFNFDGEVAKGRTFDTWDVTRIYEITGTPATVDVSQTNGETLADKTIPGIVLGFDSDLMSFYVGAGVTTFLYPTDDGFDVDGSLTSATWNRTEDIGYKAGFSFDIDDMGEINRLLVKAEYVGHSKTNETGSLLKDAASFYTYAKFADYFVFDFQFAASKAGDNPYRVNSSGNWFEIASAGELVYSDSTMADQNWIGELDFALEGRVGLQFNNILPYVLYRYQGEHYVFRERESAHRLRTADDSLSHGGLHRMGFGSYFKVGQFVINPEFEAMIAKNAVFTKSADIQQSRLNSSYRKNDYLLRLKVMYKYDKIKDLFNIIL